MTGPTEPEVVLDDAAEPPLRGSAVFLWGVGGAVVGALIVFADFGSWTHDQRKFLETGPPLLWATLICAQTAAWAVAIPVLRRLRLGLEHKWNPRILLTAASLEVVVAAGAIGGAVAPNLADWESFDYLAHRAWKISLLGVVESLAAVYGLVGMWRIYAELRTTLRAGGIGLGHLERYRQLQGKLQLLIGVLGATLGLVILAVGAERNAVEAYGQRLCAPGASCDTHFPSEYVLVYGFYFTALLAFAYAPVQLALVTLGRRMREAAAPTADLLKPGADIAAWQSKRAALDEILDLKTGTASSFRAALAVLTPLIGSLTGLLFGTGG